MIEIGMLESPTSLRRAGVAIRVLAAVALTLALAACAGGPGGTSQKTGQGPAKELERRATERWQLIIEGKADEAYTYLTPGYRSTHDQSEYARTVVRGPIKWNKAVWQGVECDAPDTCKTQIMVDYSVKMPGAGDVPSFRLMQENWLLIDGEWYFLPES